MTNSNLSAIQAHVITTQLDDHEKAKDDSSPKSDYCYMFTWGYLSDAGNQTIGQPTSEPTEGPAGEIGFSKEDTSFSITVVDSTAKNLKNRDWNLGTTGTLRGENFSPAPWEVQYPIVTTLSIDFTGVPQEQHGRYKGYWLTLEADDDSIIELDPRGYGDTCYIDEVYVKINGKQQYLWRAVGQEGLPHERSECFGYGETVEVYLRVKYDGAAAKRFFKRWLSSDVGEPRKIVTYKLRSYAVRQIVTAFSPDIPSGQFQG